MQRCRGFTSTDGSISSPQAVRNLVGGKVDLWYFQSPKNKCRYVLCGELLYLLAIAMEADRAILSYAPCEKIEAEGSNGVISPHLRAQSVHGEIIQYLTIRTRGVRGHKGSSRLPAQDEGIVIITDEWLYQRRVLLENWIFLVAAINRIRKTPWFYEARVMHEALSKTQGCELSRLLDLPGIDKAHMLGAVADALQRGTAKFDTAVHQLNLSSLIEPGESSWDNRATHL